MVLRKGLVTVQSQRPLRMSVRQETWTPKWRTKTFCGFTTGQKVISNEDLWTNLCSSPWTLQEKKKKLRSIFHARNEFAEFFILRDWHPGGGLDQNMLFGNIPQSLIPHSAQKAEFILNGNFLAKLFHLSLLLWKKNQPLRFLRV